MMTARQHPELGRLFLNVAAAHGWPNGLWTAA